MAVRTPTPKASTPVRKLSSIANDILADWKTIPYYARYYAEKMATYSYLSDRYRCETGYDVVENFLSEASDWRGALSRRIKAELKDMIQRSDMR